MTGGHVTAGEEIEQHHPVEDRPGGSFQDPLHLAGGGFVRDDEGEVAAERRKAWDVAERDGPSSFHLDRGDVELCDGDAPGEVETIRFGRVELTHHADPTVPDDHRARPTRMERSIRPGLDPPSDAEPAQDTIEDPLRIQRVPSSVLGVEPLPRSSCEEDREVLSLVDRVGEAEDVPDLEQSDRGLPAQLIATRGIEEAREQAGPEERFLRGGGVRHPHRIRVPHQLDLGSRRERQ
jgi:hypothetical protein